MKRAVIIAMVWLMGVMPLQLWAFGYIPLTLGELVDGSDAIVVAKVAKVVRDEPDSIADYRVDFVTFLNFSFADETYTIQVIEQLNGKTVPPTLQFLQKPGFSSCPPTPRFDNDTSQLLLMFLEQTDNGFVGFPNADGLKTVTNRELKAYKNLIAQRLELMQGASKRDKKQIDFKWQFSCLKYSVTKWDAYRSIAKHLGLLGFWGYDIEPPSKTRISIYIKTYFNQFGITALLKSATIGYGMDPYERGEIANLIHHFDPAWQADLSPPM